MNTLKKIIFLSNNEKNKGMGILKLERKNNNIFGSLKIYQSNLTGDYILGIKSDDKVIKQNVNLSNSAYSFVLSEKIDLNNPTGCVLLRDNQTDFTPLLWGNEKNKNFKSSIITTLKEGIRKLSNTNQNRTNDQSFKNIVTNSNSNDILLRKESDQFLTLNQDNLNKKNSNYTDSTQEHLQCNSKLKQLTEDLITAQQSYTTNHNIANHSNYVNLSVDTTIKEQAYSPVHYEQHNVYHTTHVTPQISLEPENIFNYQQEEIAIATSQASLFESSEDEIEKLIDNELKNIKSGEHKFYDMISDQLQEIFDRYPKETNLTNLVDNSSWVKINNDNDNKYYVVGIIKHNNDIKYICYGVPGSYSNEPPIEMREYSQWLPTDVRNPYNMGYWVMYQDADTGENIFIN